MIANPLVRKVVRAEYTILRTPLAVVDQRVVAPRFGDDSMLHISIERGLHTLDAVADRLLGDSTAPAPEPASAEHAEELEHEREQIAETILEEEPVVGERADPDLDVAEVQAQLRAKHAVEEREEQRRLKEEGQE